MDKGRKQSLVRSPTSITFGSEIDLKEYEKSRNSIKGRFQDFCSDTSFTPLSHVYKAGSVWKKLVWVCVSLGLTAYMAYQCSTLIQNYLKYPSEVDMELAFAPELEFPSVTVCNLNPIRYNKLLESKYAQAFQDLEDDGTNDLLYQAGLEHLMPWENSHEDLYGFLESQIEERYSEEYSGSDSGETPETPWLTPPDGQYTEPNPMSQDPAGATPPVVNDPTQGPTGSPPPQLPRRRRRRGLNSTVITTAANFTDIISNSSYNQWDQLGDDNAGRFYNKMSSQHQAMAMFSDIVATMDAKEVERMGHQKRDFIMSCKWQGYSCSPRNFTSFVNYKYGNCFTFNADVNISSPTESVKTSNPGPLYGLELELFIEQDEYTPSLSQQAGARVVVHSRGKVPFPEDEGFTVSPGFLTSIGMRKTTISRLPDPHGNCSTVFTGLNSLYESVNTVYSKQACMKSCYQMAIADRCFCGLASYPLPANVSLCQPPQAPCANEVSDLYIHNQLGCDAGCPPPCSDEAFTLTISNAKWPAQKYEKDLFARMMKSSTKMMRSAQSGGVLYDVAKVEIFYQELNYQRIEQKKSYEFENVLSDLGGQLGLWLGVSVLALGEIIDFLISLAHYVFFKVTSAAHHHRPGSTPVYPYRPPKD